MLDFERDDLIERVERAHGLSWGRGAWVAEGSDVSGGEGYEGDGPFHIIVQAETPFVLTGQHVYVRYALTLCGAQYRPAVLDRKPSRDLCEECETMADALDWSKYQKGE